MSAKVTESDPITHRLQIWKEKEEAEAEAKELFDPSITKFLLFSFKATQAHQVEVRIIEVKITNNEVFF